LGRICIAPLDGPGIAIVETDVTHELPSEVFDRREDATGDDISLDFGEPVLYLVEPRRVCGGEVEADLLVSSEEIVNSPGLMGGEVVRDDVDRLPLGLACDDVAKKGHELLTRMTLCWLAKHLSGPRVEGGVERQGPMAKVLESVAFGSPRRERKHRIQAIERLDGCLFIKTEYGGVLGRLQVKTDDVCGLLFETRIVGEHVPFDPVRFQSGPSPNSRYQHVAHTENLRELPSAPLGGSIRWLASRPLEDSSFRPRSENARLAPLMPGVKPGESVFEKSAFPERSWIAS
jgi:hypothetical protein